MRMLGKIGLISLAMLLGAAGGMEAGKKNYPAMKIGIVLGYIFAAVAAFM